MSVLRTAVFAVLGLAAGYFLSGIVHAVRSRDGGEGLPSGGLRKGTGPRGRREALPALLFGLATAGLFAAASVRIERTYAAALVAPFLGLLLALSVIDARHRVIPNRIVYPALAVAALLIVAGDLTDGGVVTPPALVGFAAYGAPLLVLALIAPRGMGMGDVKLAGLIGLVLGSLGLRFVAVAAGLGFLAGGVGALVALVLPGYGRHSQIPFGPYLAVGAIVAALAAEPVADAYRALVG